MTESARTIPHISLSVEVDMSELQSFRSRILREIEKEKGIRVSVTELLVKIVSMGLRKHPVVNSTFEEQRIKVFKEINLGVAMAAGEGLIVPVVHKADERSVSEISSRVKELSQKAQAGNLSLEDVTGGTFTLTNLGMYGIDKFTAIINPPQCAILAVGKVSEKPAVEERRVVIKPMAWLTLSADHRILDGKQGAEFLSEVKRLVENPYLALV
jgi:pyruvate dehydrogenase E2 component (dihydrolipoamide acetyltransferase)